ncbi:unnamed protein product [Clavelina lepadiformis]|uniref:Golgi apparatus membrane protein TVP23 homolog n=1 Tax=Clavelina lepadiformis TaxID=159417 RepID=A0ABP0FTX2_CLALP
MDTDDTVLEFGSEHQPKMKKTIIHPIACFFHLIFRVSALVVYIFCGWSDAGFVTSFIIILLLLSADFWTVKNVTGRLLVGLRWWNKVAEGGESAWVFESRKPASLKKHPVYKAESMIFWLGLILPPVLWFLMLFSALFGFNFHWLAVVVVALILNGANLFGYVRCKFKSRGQIGSLATKYIGAQLFKSMQSSEGSEGAKPSSTTF